MSVGQVTATNTKISILISSHSCIVTGRRGERRWWRVAGDRIEMIPAGSGWDTRVERAGWAGLSLDLNAPCGHFDDEAEGLAWCQRMADVLAQDVEDDLDPA